MQRKVSEKQLKRLLYPDGRQKDIYRKISYPLVKTILPLNIHPDFIHLCRLVLCIAATIFFFQGNFVSVIIGAVLFQLNILFDTFDGALARHQGKASVKGEYQDVALDHLTSSVLYFASAAGFIYALTHDEKYLWLGILTIMLAQVAAFVRAMYTEYEIAGKKNNSLVSFCQQDSSRLIAAVLLIVAVFMMPLAAVIFFLLLVIVKILVLIIDVQKKSGKNPLNVQVFVRYVLLVFVIFLTLCQMILGVDTKRIRTNIAKSKHRSVIEKQITAKLH